MRAIKHVLTERWYAWEDARKLAKRDPGVNLQADIVNGESAHVEEYEAAVRIPVSRAFSSRMLML